MTIGPGQILWPTAEHMRARASVSAPPIGTWDSNLSPRQPFTCFRLYCPYPMPESDEAARLDELHALALKNTRQSLEHMARHGIRPEGHVGLFLPVEARQADIHRLPYEHGARQVVVYETEPGEFSALCPFSGLPDFGTVRVEYVPGGWILELKSLKYYYTSWRSIGAAQEDLTAIIFEDLMRHLEDPHYLVVTTAYNVRGGINTTCTVDSRMQD